MYDDIGTKLCYLNFKQFDIGHYPSNKGYIGIIGAFYKAGFSSVSVNKL